MLDVFCVIRNVGTEMPCSSGVKACDVSPSRKIDRGHKRWVPDMCIQRGVFNFQCLEVGTNLLRDHVSERLHTQC